VFPAAAIGIYLLLTGNLKHLLKLRLFSSALFFLRLPHLGIFWRSARIPRREGESAGSCGSLVNEHFLRFLNKRVPRDYDTVPLLILGFADRVAGSMECSFRKGCWKFLGAGASSARRCRAASTLICSSSCGD
jgi:hypothetical protein